MGELGHLHKTSFYFLSCSIFLLRSMGEEDVAEGKMECVTKEKGMWVKEKWKIANCTEYQTNKRVIGICRVPPLMCF